MTELIIFVFPFPIQPTFNVEQVSTEIQRYQEENKTEYQRLLEEWQKQREDNQNED